MQGTQEMVPRTQEFPFHSLEQGLGCAGVGVLGGEAESRGCQLWAALGPGQTPLATWCRMVLAEALRLAGPSPARAEVCTCLGRAGHAVGFTYCSLNLEETAQKQRWGRAPPSVLCFWSLTGDNLGRPRSPWE